MIPLTIIPCGFPLGAYPLLACRPQLHLTSLGSRSLHRSWADVHQCSVVLLPGSVPPPLLPSGSSLGPGMTLLGLW